MFTILRIRRLTFVIRLFYDRSACANSSSDGGDSRRHVDSYVGILRRTDPRGPTRGAFGDLKFRGHVIETDNEAERPNRAIIDVSLRREYLTGLALFDRRMTNRMYSLS